MSDGCIEVYCDWPLFPLTPRLSLTVAIRVLRLHLTDRDRDRDTNCGFCSQRKLLDGFTASQRGSGQRCWRWLLLLTSRLPVKYDGGAWLFFNSVIQFRRVSCFPSRCWSGWFSVSFVIEGDFLEKNEACWLCRLKINWKLWRYWIHCACLQEDIALKLGSPARTGNNWNWLNGLSTKSHQKEGPIHQPVDWL